MTVLVLAFGLVLVIEGLVLALAPSRLEQMLTLLATLTPEQRRAAGLAAVALGVAVVAAGRWLAGWPG